MPQQIDVVEVQVEPLISDRSPGPHRPKPAALVLHLQRKHGWYVSFAGWHFEDLLALHRAEHDEQVNPQRPEPPRAA